MLLVFILNNLIRKVSNLAKKKLDEEEFDENLQRFKFKLGSWKKSKFNRNVRWNFGVLEKVFFFRIQCKIKIKIKM